MKKNKVINIKEITDKQATKTPFCLSDLKPNSHFFILTPKIFSKTLKTQ